MDLQLSRNTVMKNLSIPCSHCAGVMTAHTLTAGRLKVKCAACSVSKEIMIPDGMINMLLNFKSIVMAA